MSEQTPAFRLMRDWIYAHRETERLDGAEMFMGIPDRWFDHPTWRCESGHVSSVILKSEEEGDLCLACHCRVLMTFPEDRESDPPTPLKGPA